MTSLASHAYDPAAQGDDGSAAPEAITALSAYADGTGGPADVIATLSAGRLLVPVVAVLDEAAEGGSEKASHMATVLTTGRDGRRGLLAFTSTESMRAWNESARPVPVPTRRAAEAALADGADALVIDIAGPVTFSVDAAELRALAAGWRAVQDEYGGAAWAVTVGLAESDESAVGAQAEDGRGVATAARDDIEPMIRRRSGTRLVTVSWRLARATAGVLASRISNALSRRRATE
ncbi:MAG TPA: SseB family protein [Jiangellaceae bacterium]